jgi:histone-lysine N-methyltransferase SETMAR
VRGLSEVLGFHGSTIDRHLQQLGLTKVKCREIPHELSQEQAQRRVDICGQLLANLCDEHFFRRIVTCDEKWIFFRNPDTRGQWVFPGERSEPVAKRERFEHKVMLCVWWNYQGIIHYELIPDGRSVNSDIYSNQLRRVYEILWARYPEFVDKRQLLLQHDNARPHVSRKTPSQLKALEGIDVLPHPAYSPDLAPSDYHLFRSMAHFLRGPRFETIEQVERSCREFFASKYPDWYKKGIEELAHRWIEVIESNGLYFEC